MLHLKDRSCLQIARLVVLSSSLFLSFVPSSAGQNPSEAVETETWQTLVRVNITMEALTPGEAIIINGRRLEGYQPKIVQVFPATGVVIDDKGHIVTFLGYRWIDIRSRDPRIEIISAHGQAHPGRMIGIDESAGVAVVRSMEGRLPRTPFCADCRVRDGNTVVSPVFDLPGRAQFEAARILSLVQEDGEEGRSAWMMRISRLPGVGEPLLDSEHRVLGFVASQRPSSEDPEGMRTVVYPISQLLSSAERILKTGGDVRTGWLGVYLADSAPGSAPPVVIRSVEAESPAQRAGLSPEDALLKWNGTAIAGVRRFIQMVQSTAIGSKVALQILRRGKPITVYPVIETRRQPKDTGAFVVSFPDTVTLRGSGAVQEAGRLPRSWIGITAMPLSPDLADGLQIRGQAGLLILGVEPRTPFSQAGLMVGDVIIAADDSRVDDLKDLYRYIQSRPQEGRVVLRLLRKGSERTASLALPLKRAQDEQR